MTTARSEKNYGGEDELEGNARDLHMLPSEAKCEGECTWACVYCDGGYGQRRSPSDRVNLHAGPLKLLPRPLCAKQFTKNSRLEAHLRTHTGRRDYLCTHCHKTFTKKSVLVEHLKIHQGQKYKCEFCGKAFIQKGVYVAHLKLHTGKDLWPCEYCGKKFNRKSSLVSHVRLHTGDCLHCTLCQKAFVSASKLLSHIRAHSGVKEFKCDICDRTYVEKNSLRQHYILHTLGKTFKCHICDKSFGKKVTLQKHELLHGDTKRPPNPTKSMPDLLCHRCGCSYRRRSSLVTHLQTHHQLGNGKLSNEEYISSPLPSVGEVESESGGEMPSTGDSPVKIKVEPDAMTSYAELSNSSELENIFGDLNGISLNMLGKPPSVEEIRSLALSNVLSQSAFVPEHIITAYTKEKNGISTTLNKEDGEHVNRLNACNVCRMTFSDKRALTTHLTLHYATNQFACSQCSKVLDSANKLKLHLRCHKRELSFPCRICDKEFHDRASLLSHAAIHTGARPFRCPHRGCHKTFINKVCLKRHEMSHSGIRPHPCPHCPKRFAQKNHLENHLKIHSGEKPFLCAFCGKSFSRSDVLTSHIRTHTLKHLLKDDSFQAHSHQP